MIIPNRLKIIKYGKHNYTSIINDKQYFYTFYNNKSAQKCCMFLSEYKRIYGKWPFIKNFYGTEKVNYSPIEYEKRENIHDIYKTLEIKEYNRDYLQDMSTITNIGIIGISDFDYIIKSNNRMFIMFKAQDITEINKNISQEQIKFKMYQTLDRSFYNTIQQYYEDKQEEDSDDYYDFNLDSEFNEL